MLKKSLQRALGKNTECIERVQNTKNKFKVHKKAESSKNTMWGKQYDLGQKTIQ